MQYPGAGPALMADLSQLSRLAWLFARISPGLEVKPLIAEIKQKSGIMYFAFFAIGFLSGTIVMAGGGKKGAAAGKPSKSDK